MEIAFCRIDDRLIHGQVATVWSKVTGCNRIMCVSDEVAKDELRKKLLLQVVPPGLKGYVIPVAKAIEAYKNPKYDSFKTLFLFTNPTDVLRAVKGGIPFKSVNLGGKCFKDGDTLNCVLDNLYLISRAKQLRKNYDDLPAERKTEIRRQIQDTRKKSIKRDQLRLRWGLEPLRGSLNESSMKDDA